MQQINNNNNVNKSSSNVIMNRQGEKRNSWKALADMLLFGIKLLSALF